MESVGTLEMDHPRDYASHPLWHGFKMRSERKHVPHLGGRKPDHLLGPEP
jgi:hypothetical protein